MHRERDGSRSIRCVVMRGGTTRGVFFHAEDLPAETDARDRVLMAVIGGPDPRQVDGIGGADLLLSKVALVWPSDRAGVDVECRFGSITPGSKSIKYGANCGNLAAAVALFALQEGLVDPAAQRVRIRNPDSNAIMEARLVATDSPVNGRSTQLSGMPVTGSLVELAFLNPSGTAGESLLPTGNVVDDLETPDGRVISASIVDAGAQYVFLRADELGLDPAATSELVQNDRELMAVFEHLRGQAAVLTGLASSVAEAKTVTPSVPKLAFVGPPNDYRCEGRNVVVSGNDVHLLSRIISSQSFHKAYAVTGAIATASAAVVPGTVVHQLVHGRAHRFDGRLLIGHPTGIMECTVQWSLTDGEIVVERAGVMRTARRIMEGRSCLHTALRDPHRTRVGGPVA